MKRESVKYQFSLKTNIGTSVEKILMLPPDLSPDEIGKELEEWCGRFRDRWQGTSERIVECVYKEVLWTLEGYDTFSDERYPFSGAFESEASARAAADERLDELERQQPSSRSGGQEGIQDRVYIVRPDGTRYRYLKTGDPLINGPSGK
jgi:hypothetical protein